MDVVRKCIMCGEPKVIVVNQKGYEAWQNGALIQVALPKLSADDKEMLISGICGACWDKIFEE